MKLEMRYVVLKIKDIRKYLTDEQTSDLWKLCDKIQAGRSIDNKGPISSIVIEDDWPEYVPTLRLLSNRVDNENI